MSSWFGKVPEWICGMVENGMIGGSDLAVFTVLCIHADKDGKCYPNVPTLARMSGYSERNVKRSIKRLIAAKAVVLLKKGTSRGHSNLYRIQPVPYCHQSSSRPVPPCPEPVPWCPPTGDTVAYQQIHGTDPLTEDLERKRNTEALDKVRRQLKESRVIR